MLLFERIFILVWFCVIYKKIYCLFFGDNFYIYYIYVNFLLYLEDRIYIYMYVIYMYMYIYIELIENR